MFQLAKPAHAVNDIAFTPPLVLVMLISTIEKMMSRLIVTIELGKTSKLGYFTVT